MLNKTENKANVRNQAVHAINQIINPPANWIDDKFENPEKYPHPKNGGDLITENMNSKILKH